MHIRPFISLLLVAALSPHALAADADTSPKPGAEQDAGPKSYIGESLRLGIGYDTKTKLRGEYYQVLQEDAAKAFISEAWVSGSAAGFKLNHHWIPQGDSQSETKYTSVNKLFVALDQNEQRDRKFTVGGGAEYADWFWGSYLSHGLTARRQISANTVSAVVNSTGIEAGRPYTQQITTATTTNIFERPYDYGIGVMAGQFYDPALLRVYARLDHEWGRSSASQDTIGVGVEKFFANSPISVALNAEAYRKSGDFEVKQNDQRVNLVVRYEFGGKSYRSERERETRRVAVTPSVAAADSAPTTTPAPASAASAPPPAAVTASVTQLDSSKKTEMRIVKTTASMSADAFFDFDKAIVTPAARTELDGVIARLKSSGYTGNVRLTGHTCNIGTDAYNLRLSERRAAAVKEYMAAHGVAADSIIVEGKGEAEPRFPNNTAASRQKNRRVDLEFVTYVDKMQEVVVAQAGKPDAAAAVKPDVAPAKPAVPAAVEWRTETIDSEPAWVRRALHNTIRHKQTVDVYRQVEQSTTVTNGARVFINRSPAAANDSFQVQRNSSNNLFDVMANDSDPDNEPLRIQSVTSPAHGTATINGNRVSYTPTAGYLGGDIFTYTITDDKGGTATASITVLISAGSTTTNAPIAVNDAFTVVGNSASNLFDVLKNDSDPDGDSIRVKTIQTPAHGIVSISGNGIAYTPTVGYVGTDSFTYTISDTLGLTATATVTVTVTPPNAPPIARDDESWVIWGQPIRIYVLANDMDPNGDPLTITSIGPVANGTATINGDNIIYRSSPTFTGRETFTYTISDGRGGTATATVRVTVVDP